VDPNTIRFDFDNKMNCYAFDYFVKKVDSVAKLSVATLSVATLSVATLSVATLSVATLSVATLSVAMLSVATLLAPPFPKVDKGG
jgi:uncharacterized protein YjbI with pentapeptide repeats